MKQHYPSARSSPPRRRHCACWHSPAPAAARKEYGPGVTDTEIKIGNTMPYSGPASSYGTIGKIEAAYSR